MLIFPRTQVNEGENVVFRNITLSAVSASGNEAKNTDGWDVYRSNNVVIQDSNINNGDDCVSFKPSTFLHCVDKGTLTGPISWQTRPTFWYRTLCVMDLSEFYSIDV